MAEGYQHEDEQVEALKRWWKENGQSTVTGVVLALAAVFGWQAWDKNQQAEKEAASAVYQNLLTTINSGAAGLNEQQQATVNHLAETLKSDYASSTYAQLGALFKAKVAVQQQDYASAEQELRWVLAAGAGEEISSEANLRLARVLAAQEKYADALSLLDSGDAAYASINEEVRGDIYKQQGNADEALLAYQKSLELNQQLPSPRQAQILELKKDALQAVVDSGPDSSSAIDNVEES